MTTDELRAILAARTPGPWASGGDEVYAGSGETYSEVCRMLADWGDPDARAIVTAVNLIDPALAVVEAARGVPNTSWPVAGMSEVAAALAAFDAAMEAEK